MHVNDINYNIIDKFNTHLDKLLRNGDFNRFSADIEWGRKSHVKNKLTFANLNQIQGNIL